MKSLSPYFHFSLPQWLAIFLFSCVGLLSSNPLLTTASLLALPLFAVLLWRRGEPPVLFCVVTFQWLEVSTKVFHADSLGTTPTKLSLQYFPEVIEVNSAIWLGLAGLLVLAAGMRLGTGRLPALTAQRLQQEATIFSPRKIWVVYLISFGLSLFLMEAAKAIPSLKQFLQTLANFRWVMFFIMAYTVIYKKEGRALLFLATLFEIALGFIGYFSKFKYVFYVLILAFLAVGYRFTRRNVIRITATAAMGLFLCIFWMSISEEYRSFLNLGTRETVVLVSVRERVEKLIELSSRTNGETLKRGWERLLQRIAYVDMFAHVLTMVPNQIPHENGALWMRVPDHILRPRLFFQNKPGLPLDTEDTRKYTGLWYLGSGATFATSISMGYMAESYIDFGPVGMFVPVFLLGLLWGFIFRFLVSKSQMKIYGYAAAIAVLIDTLNFGSNNVKVVGGVITGFIVLALALRFFTPFLNRMLQVRKR